MPASIDTINCSTTTTQGGVMGIHGRVACALALSLITFGAMNSHAADIEAVPGEYVVKLKHNMRVSDIGTLLNSEVKSIIPEDNLVVVKRSIIERSDWTIKSLQQIDLVEYAEPNFIYRILKTPNDPNFGKLWGLKNIGQSDVRAAGVAGVDIEAEKAWDITTGSEKTLVAVIDTGIDYTHPDLKENLWVNSAEMNGQPGIDDDENGIVDDIYGANFANAKAPTGDPKDDHSHGTHCAGTIGARGDDGVGVTGVAWNVKLMGVKFLSASGGGTLEGAIKAIDYATKMGAKIFSNSWGGGGESQALKEAIQRANAAGVLFIAAAGNNSSNNDTTPNFPSNYPVANVLAVAANDNQGKLASFSNYGKKTVHVAAPGVNVYSSVLNGSYGMKSGTSMATPHVSGIAALIASAEPNLTAVEIKERIIKTARPLASVKDKVSSRGMASAYAALTGTVAPPDANDPENWQSVTYSLSSAHPYAKKSNETFNVKVDGAKEIAIYFEKFETEKTYDKLSIYDSSGALVEEVSGLNSAEFSAVIKGDSAKLVFTSDDSVEKYGFDISKIAYR